eukprot:4522406-Prymnesium_polylepis.1
MTLCSAATLASTADANFVYSGHPVPPAPNFQTAPVRGNIRPQFKAAFGKGALSADACSRTRAVGRVAGQDGDGATIATAAFNCGRQGCHDH